MPRRTMKALSRAIVRAMSVDPGHPQADFHPACVASRTRFLDDLHRAQVGASTLMLASAEDLLPRREADLEGVVGQQQAHEPTLASKAHEPSCRAGVWDYLWHAARASDMIGATSQAERSSEMESSRSRPAGRCWRTRRPPRKPLLDAVRERAQRGPPGSRCSCRGDARPAQVVDPEDQDAGETQSVINQALPDVDRRRRTPVEALVGDADPGARSKDAINLHGSMRYHSSTLSPRVARWLERRPSKVTGLGLPVTT